MKNLYSFLILILVSFSSFGQGNSAGCTDASAFNFSPLASIDDGTCCYNHWVVFSSNDYFDLSVSDNNGVGDFFSFPGSFGVCLSTSCIELYMVQVFPNDVANIAYSYNGLPNESVTLTYNDNHVSLLLAGGLTGCMDTTACNYNALATCTDQSCEYQSCAGCTDSTAINFSPSATIDDGMCCYDLNTQYTIEVNVPVTFGYTSPDLWQFQHVQVDSSAHFCFSGTCLTFSVSSPEQAEFVYSIFSPTGQLLVSDTAVSYANHTISSTGVMNCNDPLACNYVASDACPDYSSCVYGCSGCTDPLAPNFDPTATIDDGSCCNVLDYCMVTADQSCYIQVGEAGNGAIVQIQNPGDSAYICIPDGCWNYDVYFSDQNGPDNFVYIYDAGGNVLLQASMMNWLGEVSGNFGKGVLAGCMDSLACDYSPNATCPGQCSYSCYGCTNPEAINYDDQATIDDGSCCLSGLRIICADHAFYSVIDQLGVSNTGFTDIDSVFCIVDGCHTLHLNTDDGTNYPYQLIGSNGDVIASGVTSSGFAQVDFEINPVYGCADWAACNYDPNTTCLDWSICTYDCIGCMLMNALNYDPEATQSGFCCYSNYNTINVSSPGVFQYRPNDGSTYFSTVNMQAEPGFCVETQCFEFSFQADVAAVVHLTITGDSNLILFDGDTDSTGYILQQITQGEVLGCLDVSACNYNADATCGNLHQCDYSCLGCMDAAAANYDASATIDDGSCCSTADWMTIYGSGSFYWVVSAANGVSMQSGVFPSEFGFCSTGSCFSLKVYLLTANAADFTIYNSSGEITYSGSTGLIPESEFIVSTGPLVSGCTDITACNYSAAAQCDAGNCVYYCGGCVDPSALNYSTYAQYDDGTCIYTFDPPHFVINTEVSNGNVNQYFVRVLMINTGNGSPYLASNDVNSEAYMIDANGEYWMGPFECNTDVTVNVLSTSLGSTEFSTTGTASAVCTTIEEFGVNEPQVHVYPNPSKDQFNIEGWQEESALVRLYDLSGRMVFENRINNTRGRIQITTNDLSEGIYQLCISGRNAIATEKIIIQR